MKNWNPRANEVFARAIEFTDADKRAAYIERECGDDEELRARVEEMIATIENAGSFLQSPAHLLEFPPDGTSERESGSLGESESGPSDPALEKTLSPSPDDTDHEDVVGTAVTEHVRDFGDYELLTEIARGGMGVVYKARQKKLNRIVALKMILAGQLASDQEVQRFQAEAEAAAGLDHVGIVPVFEVGEYKDRHFFSMGFVEGGSLSSLLKDGPLPPLEAAALTKQIAEAVAYAHGMGVIHRDLKPANVLLDLQTGPKITDFGLAKNIELDSGLTGTGQILGTPGFMSPEQASGQNASIEPATDIYAIGAILYNLLTGRAPFQGSSAVETLKLVLEQEPVSPRLLNPAVNQDLQTICLKCLEKDAGRRYPSAQALADELSRYLVGEPIEARPISALARSWRWCCRNPVVAGLASTAVLLLIAGTIISGLFSWEASQNASQAKKNFETSEIQRKRADTNFQTAKARELEARDLLKKVTEQARTSRRKLYNAQMNVCGLSAESDGSVSLIQQHLGNWLPVTGEEDLRGWEWHFFDTHIHQAAQTINMKSQGFALDWSPNGEYLAIAGSAGITILNRHGQQVAELNGHEHFVRAVKWDPAGKRLASGCLAGSLFLWDDPLHSTEHRQLPCARETILSLDWSHDGIVLAALFEAERRVELWQPDTEDLPTVITGTGRQLCFSPVDRRLACAEGNDVHIWQVNDPKSPHIIETLSDNGAMVKSLAWSPSGRQVIAGLVNSEIKHKDLKTGQVRTLSGHTESVYDLAWGSDATRFVSGSFDYTVRIWNAEEFQEVETLRGHTDRVFAAQAHPELAMIASTGEDRSVRLWIPDNASIRDVTGDTHGLTPGHNDQWQIAWNPATAAIATSGITDSAIRDGKTLALARTLPGSHVCWNHDGRLAAFSEDSRVSLWNFETDLVEARAQLSPEGSSDIRVDSMTWDPLQDRIAIVCTIYTDAGAEACVFVWEVGQQEPKRVLDLDVLPLCAAFNPGGNELAIGCNYGAVRIWDQTTGDLTSVVLDVGQEAVHAIAWSPDGNRVAMGCADHSVQIRDMNNGVITPLRGHTFPVWGVDWHPHEERLASASGDRTVRIWDTVHGEMVTTLKTDDSARAVAWHSDGKRLAALSGKQTLKIWDAADRSDLETRKDESPSLWNSIAVKRNTDQLQVLRSEWEAVDTKEWFDMLPLVNLLRDQHVGEWTRVNDAIQSDAGVSSRIHVMAIPPNNYDLKVRFSRISGNEAVAVTIPVGDAQCRIVLSGWGGEQSGLDRIDGVHPPYGNPTHSLFVCETDVEHLLEVSVTCRDALASVTTSVDGEVLFRWEGDTSRLSMASHELLNYPHCFGLGSYESEFRFSELSIRTSSPKD